MADSPLQRYAADFLTFAADLHVQLGASSGRLGDSWAAFQERDFQAIAPSLHALARGEVAPVRRFWICRTKGGSKDSDCAVAVLWLLAFSPRPVRIQVGAYDKQQADELRYIATAILAIDAPLNRLLRSKVKVQRDRIVAHADTAGRSESACEILTTDAFGSHGARPDVVIANELSHVGSEAFMQTLLDNADKVPHSLVIVATNAGEISTWQDRWREIAESSDRWHYSVLNDPAPWVSADDLRESEQRNPPERFRRLWRGEWSTGEGDALSGADIAACTSLDEPDYLNKRAHPGRILVGGIDLGVKHDHSAVAIVAIDTVERRVELVHCESWRPQDFADGRVDIATVKNAIINYTRHYGVAGFFYDPWQAMFLSQQLASEGVNVEEFAFTSGNKDRMARALLEAFRNRTIALYPDDDLRRDLLRLRIKEGMAGQFRLDAVRDDQGHADRAIALAIVLPDALEAATTWAGDLFTSPRDEVLYA